MTNSESFLQSLEKELILKEQFNQKCHYLLIMMLNRNKMLNNLLVALFHTITVKMVVQ